MSEGEAAGGIEDLPRVIPIFPLPGVLLLPRGRLPLNIFEPRYLEMTQDAMASHRTIGMIQPADPAAKLDAPEVYAVGCAGRITSFQETPDNRFLITLTGVCRFAITREIEQDGLLYRRVSADYSRFAGDLPAARAAHRRPRRACCRRSAPTSSTTGSPPTGTRSTGPTTTPSSTASPWPAPSSRARSRRSSSAGGRERAPRT